MKKKFKLVVCSILISSLAASSFSSCEEKMQEQDMDSESKIEIKQEDLF